MCRAFRFLGAAIMLGSGFLPLAEARAFELTGAWATQEDLCSQVFTKKDNKVLYAEFSELFGSGFIIDGDRIKGRIGACTIKSKKQDGNSLELSAACASSVMTQDLRFKLKNYRRQQHVPIISRDFGDEPEIYEMQAVRNNRDAATDMSWADAFVSGENAFIAPQPRSRPGCHVPSPHFFP